jgi:hypothetical protein
MRDPGQILVRILVLSFFCNLSLAASPTVEVFPQFASGPTVTTFYTVHNPGEEQLTLTIDLYHNAEDGPWHSEEVTLDPNSTQTLEFQSPQLVVGWSQLSSENSFSATSFYQMFENGDVVGQVGVLPGRGDQNFKVFGYKDDTTSTNTSVVLANPSSTKSSEITAKQLDNAGNELDRKIIVLQPEEHLARYIHEPPFFEGTGNYEGTIEFEASEPVVPMTLRQDGSLISSNPVVSAAVSGGDISITTPILGPGGNTIGGPATCNAGQGSTCTLLALLTGPDEPLSRQGIDVCFTIESTANHTCSASEIRITRSPTSSPQERTITLGSSFSGSFCDADVNSAIIGRTSGAPGGCTLSLHWRVDVVNTGN